MKKLHDVFIEAKNDFFNKMVFFFKSQTNTTKMKNMIF